MTAPAARRRSVMCASYGRDVALEDPRPGGRLAAPDRDQILERDRDAEERVERVECRRALSAGDGQPGVGGVGLVERPVVERTARR